MHKNWIPEVMDLSHIALPGELEELLEQLAENVHNVWARERMDQGWTYGPRRDDVRKQTPMLVPYGELPEEEKDYDRATAGQTLKAVLHLGFGIKKL